ncbi:methionyl-tRNA formyltransferase [Herbiconiux sp. KACC 21604]|uniref:methionyl-tRNA formyltransferase n=1 Tax=unclassified Herbiconiux TaxID=2618217 RepID=UPI001490C559|nr:methionyl-tRNA formyltransferase [Herbiconiux sp. SALV-R1]QJU53599.1 methionyl-tRNA formyltransferase [Herbiconiux sp. SALV-R1]WPO88579.1 methionyl-tRNA formyltransferase [Herbiconiux sp. KACC 21604]
MKLVFAGTPAVAVPALERLAEGHEVAAVVTRPDAPLGRKRVLTPSPVAEAAERLGLPVIKAARLDADATASISALGAELGVIVAYGGLVREPLLSAPARGWVNLHFSLLPRWRGAAPVQWSIIAGDRETGATVFQLQPGLDDGPVWSTTRTAIAPHETAGTLLGRLALSGAEQLAATVDVIAAGESAPVEQSGEVTLAPKLSIDDARLDFGEPADQVYDRIRGVTPEPGAFTEIDGARLKIHDAAPVRDHPRLDPGVIEARQGEVLVGTATEPLRLISVQPAGKKSMAAADWWRGQNVERMIAR